MSGRERRHGAKKTRAKTKSRALLVGRSLSCVRRRVVRLAVFYTCFFKSRSGVLIMTAIPRITRSVFPEESSSMFGPFCPLVMTHPSWIERRKNVFCWSGRNKRLLADEVSRIGGVASFWDS